MHQSSIIGGTPKASKTKHCRRLSFTLRGLWALAMASGSGLTEKYLQISQQGAPPKVGVSVPEPMPD